MSKGEGKARCRACVEKSVANEEAASQKSKASKIAAAKEDIEKAKAKGDMTEIVRAESVLAALEAEVRMFYLTKKYTHLFEQKFYFIMHFTHTFVFFCNLACDWVETNKTWGTWTGAWERSW